MSRESELTICFALVVPDAGVSQQFSASWKSALRKAFATGKADLAEKPKA